VVTVSAACAGLTALWVRRRIQAPIDALVEGTRQIARGGLDHRVRVSGRDELANLAANFNWMVAEVERRRAELDHARADLERKVQERTVELEQRNRTLRQLDQARRRMFADISHAFCTPLTVIRGEAEVTLRARHGTIDDYRATLGRIVETAAQLNKLVEELLEVARSERAAVPLETNDVAATALIRDVGEDANALAAIKGIRVSCGVPRHEIHVRGDADRLRQLLLILLDNACRYTPADGEIAIRLATKKPYAVVTVRDTGIGIAPDELDLVSGRFYRGSNSPQMAPSGGGLGLHVAQSIVEAHGGDLTIESEVGRGTTVRVRLLLPDLDGREVCRQLRAAHVATPILMLTALDNLDDRVRGLRMGADDHLAKPFAFEELVARVQALARRGPVYRGEPTELKVHDLVLDRATREVRRGERLIELTPREFALLECLMRTPGKVLSRALILEKVWGCSKHPLTNVVDVYIRQLRRKIDRDPPAALIQTVRGFGYKLRNS
jgi:DNA-binding response OmpR family regulator/HAMP domain-containing protein